MHDSYTEFVLPFATDPNFLEEYVNASGGIRTGKIIEHLDSLAGSISYKHVLGPTSRSALKVEEMGLYIVTAGVERIDMLRPLNPTHDLRLSGQVIYTGRSSMEVVVRIETMAKDARRFSMVCRDAKTNQAYPVNPLIISTDEEKTLFTIGQELKLKRASLAQRSLSRVPPSSKEAAALHENYLKFGELVPMGKTRIEKCMLMFPQERNVHQKIFGGYLMRLAYEGRVRFLALDEISFKLPVPIGSILRLTSVVLYDEIHVGVQANVVDIKTGTEKTTNEFRFTKVVPKTYREAMLWLGARRAVAVGDEIRDLTSKRREKEEV
ncbi:Thioesterase/thiol ester dehydrase-isomerase [Gymnopus androsaceus JB14]|uniref:Thioesterase/thiol ester dehydrase-isomerase n=1 Tax=Gymnopus androsaceus JB14 TaxID=1447944 RepID=A0A6A4HVB5_9AGAR|nr:Thioesterase/thiol ester dehydrase-isomerase [Gymnopus androsaceus JB14]